MGYCWDIRGLVLPLWLTGLPHDPKCRVDCCEHLRWKCLLEDTCPTRPAREYKREKKSSLLGLPCPHGMMKDETRFPSPNITSCQPGWNGRTHDEDIKSTGSIWERESLVKKNYLVTLKLNPALSPEMAVRENLRCQKKWRILERCD